MLEFRNGWNRPNKLFHNIDPICLYKIENYIRQWSKTYLSDTPTDDQRANNRMCLNLSPSSLIFRYNFIRSMKITKWKSVAF